MRGSNFQNKTMNTPKEPSTVERAIEAQHYALFVIQGEAIPAGSLVGLLDTAQIKALFAVQNLYAQLEKKHGEALTEITALRAEKARLDYIESNGCLGGGTFWDYQRQQWMDNATSEPVTARQAIDAAMNKSLNEITLSKII